MRRILNFAVLLVVITLGCMAHAASTQNRRALIRILQHQGFTGALSGDIHFTTVGNLHCPASNFQVVYFEWYGPAHPSSHRAQYRILFLEDGNRYVGSYIAMGGPVSISNNSVLFTYDESSTNVITCAAFGPDESIQLQDGGSLSLEK